MGSQLDQMPVVRAVFGRSGRSIGRKQIRNSGLFTQRPLERTELFSPSGARIQRSFSTPDRYLRSDDTVIGMVAGRCDWCGEIHVYREKLDQLIAVSVVEKGRPLLMTRAAWLSSPGTQMRSCSSGITGS